MTRLEEIKARLKAATPGPWEWSKKYTASEGRETFSLISESGYGILSCDGIGNSPQSCNKPDADLIENLPFDLAYLLSALKSAEKALKQIAEHQAEIFADGVEADLASEGIEKTADVFMAGFEEGRRELQEMASAALADAKLEGKP